MDIPKRLLNKKVIPINTNGNKGIIELIESMYFTGFQGRTLAESIKLFERMLLEKDLTIILGYSGSLSVAGQSTIISWLLENNYIDILVSTGANISEDLIYGLGYSFYRSTSDINDEELFKMGLNRYYDLYGKEKDYLKLTELIAKFIVTQPKNSIFTSREFLYKFGQWLHKKGVESIVTTAAIKKIPIFCPAISDSPYGDAALIAKSNNHSIILDSFQDYAEFMSLAEDVKKTGVIYIGGGVPKDFIQLFAVTPDLLYKDRTIPNRKEKKFRSGTNESYYPHKFALQYTSDSPQWGGLSGCTFEEAVSWGKEIKNGNFVQCFCDATISLPILFQYISTKKIKRKGTNFKKYLEK